MPANDWQKTRTSLTLLLPVDLDFHAYRKTPSELVIPDDMFLREKNVDKLPTRRAYDSPERMRRLPDPLLGPFFYDLDEKKVLPVALKDVVDADTTPTKTSSARDCPWANGYVVDQGPLVKEDSVEPVVPHNNGSNGSKCPRATRSIFGKLNTSMLNGSRWSIVEDAPNTASVSFGTTVFLFFIAAAPHPTIILHTNTSDAKSVSVKTSGGPSTM
ncbi:hypothetical protein DFH08DRAFT_828547 [Mycena albidolilacea]|uniref:Uncharacterized protein n=1 Tax=Mycena albidolilacea TaxID=1033008 RepID=A0AAD6YVZ9_9AGAR|nr:hypothetical protein DFH08DRAFT_828547 [Mycena albidolilacea]